MLSLLQGGQNEHALAGTKTVGLEHVGRAEGGEELAALLNLRAVEGGVGRGGNAVARHEAFGKVLGALEHGAGLGGADDGDVLEEVVAAEVVVDALDQRILRPDNDHVDLVVDDELGDAVEVVGLDVEVGAHLRRTGIAGGDEELVDARTLCDFPGQSVLAAAAAQE